MAVSTSSTTPLLRGARPKLRLMSVLATALILSACGDSPDAMVESAKRYLSSNDVNAASIQLKNALQEKSDLAEARYLLGRVNLLQGDIPGALKELRRAAELGYPAATLAPVMAQALVRSGEFDQVLKDYADFKVPEVDAQVQVMGAVGDAYLGKADPAGAARTFESALTLMPEHAPSRVGLGRAKMLAGNLEGALVEAEAVVQQSPALGEGHMLLADIRLAQDKPDLARKALEAAAAAQPSSIVYQFALASLLLRLNDFDAAAKQLEVMKRVAAGHPSTKYVDAYLHFRHDRIAEARSGALDVVKSAPDFMPGQLLAGAVLIRQNDHALARTHLNRVIEKVPGLVLARRLLAASYLSTGEAARALETITPILAAVVHDPALMSLAGQVYLANGDFEKAELILRKSADMAPDNARARTRLGVARLAGGDTARAFADLEAAAGMDDTTGQADLALILAYTRQGQFDKALDAHAVLDRKLPNNPQTYNLKGGILLGKRDVPGAREAFERALALKPDFVAAAINLARLDLADKKPELARERFNKILQLDARNSEALLAFAELQQTLAEPPASVLSTLERAQEATPTGLLPKLALVQFHLRNREPAKALNVAQQAVALQPNDPRALESLARAQQASGANQQAVATLNRLVGLQPQSPQPLILLADAHLAAKEDGVAEQVLNRALGLQPDLAEAHQRLIAIQLSRGDRDAALRTIRTVQKQRPDFAQGYILEGDVLSQAGRWADAAVAFRKALDLGKTAEVVSKLHASLMRIDRGAEAVRVMNDWLKAEPKDLVARGYMAERALADKRYPDAARLFKLMHELAPDNALVLNNLAWSAAQAKDPKALEYAERALALAPDNPVVLDTVGVIQVDQGQVAKGLANLERAVSMSPDLVPLQLNLAKAYIKLDRKSDARKILDVLMPKLKADTPAHAEAAQLLNTL